MTIQSFKVASYTLLFDLDEAKAIFFFIIIKSILRQLFSLNPFNLTLEVRTRIMILAEHTFFTFFGWYVLVTMPNKLGLESWFMKSIDCWTEPVYPFELFKIFYQIKIGTHLEDLLHMLYTWFTETHDNKSKSGRDTKMDIHHITTAALCIGSYITRYVKIGSLGESFYYSYRKYS